MRFLHSFVTPLLLLAAGAAQAASSWGFDDAKLTVSPKKVAGGAKDKDVRQFNDKSPIAETPITFDSSDSLKLLLTIKENGKGKRPHQAFLVLRQQGTTLEAPFPLTVKENGKATVEIKHGDLPVQFAAGSSPLEASVVLASFGSSADGFRKPLFEVELTRDPNATPVAYERPLRYGKQPEIHHVFRADPTSPPKVVSLVFVLAVLATVPALFVGWLVLGANISHLPKALGAAPVAHGVFFGSIVAMEGVFYMYYLSWNLFQALPVIGLVGTAAFLSGTKALGEVQSRRLAGER
ncbi:Oligosaccharyltransferase subunit Ribophorin II-domain-containing protein [Hypoxylon rubiginosum]|uniref:Oligosaccharyltransferase subunit Ribophorin II-domain-containing protein n=1 Tax=Hypoxylon rubiginosum TaxID=110542 RepID=A0ACB9Z036_9PEZI|nr:Oligosaccharyltransferase subunit Ribophorin II-domain-containing protein [Hypoxylon rubiginosum]